MTEIYSVDRDIRRYRRRIWVLWLFAIFAFVLAVIDLLVIYCKLPLPERYQPIYCNARLSEGNRTYFISNVPLGSVYGLQREGKDIGFVDIREIFKTEYVGVDDLTLNLVGDKLQLVYAQKTLAEVDLSRYLDDKDNQQLYLIGSNLYITGGNSVDLASIVGSTGTSYIAGDGILIVGNRVSVNAPTCSGTDKLQWSGTSFVCSPDVDTDTDNQVLTLSGNTLSISGGNSVTFTNWDTDVTDDVQNLGDLQDVTITTPTSGQVLKYNGSIWVNSSDADTLGALSCGVNQIPKWNGSSWVCSNDDTGTALPTGTVVGSTVHWNGASWIENTNFIVDASGNITSGTWQGSPIDISDYTNLSAGNGLQLVGDTVSVNAPTCNSGEVLTWNGSSFVCVPDQDTNTTYSAGNGLQLTGTTFSVNSPTCSGTDKLQWNGTAFVCSPDVDTTYSAGTGLLLTGTTFSLNAGIDLLTDVDTSTTPPSIGQVLKWDGTNWVPGNDNDTTYSAGGTLLQLTGTTFSIKEGTLTGGRLCTYDVTNGLVCNTDTTSVGTDNQTLTWDGTTDQLSISGGNSVSLSDLAQTLSLVGDTLTISHTGSSVTFTNWDTDVTDDVQNLTDLQDVTISTPATNQVLKYNGTNWVNSVLSFLDLGDTPTNYGTSGFLLQTDGVGSIQYVDPLTLDVGYWQRSGTTLSPRNAGDDIVLNTGETLTISDFVQGGVVFAGAGGLLTENQAYFSWDNTTNTLQIGNTSINTGSFTLYGNMLQQASFTNNAADYKFNDILLDVSYTASGNHALRGLSVLLGPYAASGVLEDGVQVGLWVHNGVGLSAANDGTFSRIEGAHIIAGNRGTANTGVIDSLYVLWLEPENLSGTINNVYTLYLNSFNITGGTTNNYWALYQVDANANNYFAGNVGIGTDTPGRPLMVQGFLPGGHTAGFTNVAGEGVFLGSYDNQSYGSIQAYSAAAPGPIALVLQSAGGNVGVGVLNPAYKLELPNNPDPSGQGRANAWVTYSDARIKSNQQELEYGLATIMQLNPKKYVHHSTEFKDGKLVIKDEGKETIGFIAQEVYKVIPEIVYKPKDESKDLWSMDYEKLIPVLVKAIQELNSKIENLSPGSTSSQPAANYWILDNTGGKDILTTSYDVKLTQLVSQNIEVTELTSSALTTNSFKIVGDKLSIDSDGDLITTGEITTSVLNTTFVKAKSIETDTLKVKELAVVGDNKGKVTIESGKQEITVEVTGLSASDLVFVNQYKGPATNFVVDIQDGKFKIVLSQPATETLEFGWFVVRAK